MTEFNLREEISLYGPVEGRRQEQSSNNMLYERLNSYLCVRQFHELCIEQGKEKCLKLQLLFHKDFKQVKVIVYKVKSSVGKKDKT